MRYSCELNGCGGRHIERVAPCARQLLERYDWLGNVRELCNVLEYAAMVGEGAVLLEAELHCRESSPKSRRSANRRSCTPTRGRWIVQWFSRVLTALGCRVARLPIATRLQRMRGASLVPVAMEMPRRHLRSGEVSSGGCEEGCVDGALDAVAVGSDTDSDAGLAAQSFLRGGDEDGDVGAREWLQDDP